MSRRILCFLCINRQARDPDVHKKRYYTAPGRRHEKSRPLLGGGSQRAPGLTMIRLYYRDGPERIPQMSDFFAETKKYATRRPPPKSRRVAHQPRLLSAETPVSAQ